MTGRVTKALQMIKLLLSLTLQSLLFSRFPCCFRLPILLALKICAFFLIIQGFMGSAKGKTLAFFGVSLVFSRKARVGGSGESEFRYGHACFSLFKISRKTVQTVKNYGCSKIIRIRAP